jgi:MFS family permease
MLALVAFSELFGMSLWFGAQAAGGQLRQRWGIDAGQLGWLTAMVQLGFVTGTATAALLNLADLFPARRYFAVSSILAALANASLVVAPGYGAALVGRFLTGFFIAGVYPPSMKMIATWFRGSRGLAIGTLIAALTVGKAFPYLVRGAGLEVIVLSTSVAAALGALAVGFGYHDGPFAFPRRAFSWKLAAQVLHHRETRLAIGGYLGHMWELYAMWTWLPTFMAASVAAHAASNGGGAPAPWVVDALAFGAIAAGGAGCLWAGAAVRRMGYARVVTLSMAASGACALLIGLCYGAPLWILVPIAWTWGFFVVADSAQFSAMVTESAPPHSVGTALTLQTSIGFLLTMATIQIVPQIVAASDWRWAFPILAMGPALGIASIARLRQAR